MQELYWSKNFNIKQKPQEPFQKRIKTQTITRSRIKESWYLLLFSTEEGQARIQQIVKWAKPEDRGTDIARINEAEN